MISSYNKTFQVAPFNPPIWLANSHVQTILPKLLSKKAPSYRRELVKDSIDESTVAYDFYDLNYPEKDKNGKYTDPIIVLFHGLEGSSNSHYSITLAHQSHTNHFHYVVPHYRSCGGISEIGDIFYTAGDTKEMHHVLKMLSYDYKDIYVVGVSLGGNVLGKYLGEYGEDALCQSAVIASAPVDLSSAAIAMKKPIGQHIYTPYLLTPLINKALKKNLTRQEWLAIKNSKDIYEFDHIFTAPRHGYRSVNEYYRKASALPYLSKITKPTLLISAKDDPFLGITAKQSDISDAVQLVDTSHGGHIGFVQYISGASGKNKLNLNWLADTSIAFFRHHIE